MDLQRHLKLETGHLALQIAYTYKSIERKKISSVRLYLLLACLEYDLLWFLKQWLAFRSPYRKQTHKTKCNEIKEKKNPYIYNFKWNEGLLDINVYC